MSQPDFGPMESLIPHRGKVMLLDRIVDHDGENTTTGIVVGSQPFLIRSDGSVGAWLTAEYMAQSVAAHEGILARTDNRTLPLGFLVSVVGLELKVQGFDSGEALEVRTRRVRGRPALGALSHVCTMSRRAAGGALSQVAAGRLSISIPRPEADAG